MKKNAVEKTDLTLQVAYMLDGVTYVPHFRNSSIFVGPGYPRLNKNRFSKDLLLGLGAKPKMELLWPRATLGAVTDINP